MNNLNFGETIKKRMKKWLQTITKFSQTLAYTINRQQETPDVQATFRKRRGAGDLIENIHFHIGVLQRISED